MKANYPALRTRAAIPVCKAAGDNFSSETSKAKMHRFVITFLVLVSLGAPAARADFVMAGSRPPAPIVQIAPVPASDSAAGDAPKAVDAAETEAPRFKVAEGFGDQVPLRFAVRQIVPPAVNVTYGPGAMPDALVDWKGGQGWSRVLFRAVHPLGLRLVMSYMAVQIRK